MIGQYPFAALVGKAIDHYGPWSCSLASSVLFSSGFGLFALEVAKTPDDITVPSQSSFERLSLFYFMAGLGTVTSYFSSLFAASKNFPDYIGIASGSSMALFGLSPLFLSVIASSYFTLEDGSIDVTGFVTFMAILTGVVHVIGALLLRTPQIAEVEATIPSEILDDEESLAGPSTDERSPLLAKNKKNDVQVQVTVVPVESKQTIIDLLRDPYFWLLAFLVLVCLGSVSDRMFNLFDKLAHTCLVRNGDIEYWHNRPFPPSIFKHILHTPFEHAILTSFSYGHSSPSSIYIQHRLPPFGRTSRGLRFPRRFLSPVWHHILLTETPNQPHCFFDCLECSLVLDLCEYGILH